MQVAIVFEIIRDFPTSRDRFKKLNPQSIEFYHGRSEGFVTGGNV